MVKEELRTRQHWYERRVGYSKKVRNKAKDLGGKFMEQWVESGTRRRDGGKVREAGHEKARKRGKS